MKKINRIIVIMLIFVFTFVLSSCNSNKGVLVQDEEWNDMINSHTLRHYGFIDPFQSDIIGLYWSFTHEDNSELIEGLEDYFMPMSKLDYAFYEIKESNFEFIGLYLDEKIDEILSANGLIPLALTEKSDNYTVRTFYSLQYHRRTIDFPDCDLKIYSYQFNKPRFPKRIDNLVLTEVLKVVTYEVTQIATGEKKEFYLCVNPALKAKKNYFYFDDWKNGDNELIGYYNTKKYRDALTFSYSYAARYFYCDGIKCIKIFKIGKNNKGYNEFYVEYYDFIEQFIVKEETIDNTTFVYIDANNYINALKNYNNE